jgi:hypothetical protein
MDLGKKYVRRTLHWTDRLTIDASVAISQRRLQQLEKFYHYYIILQKQHSYMKYPLIILFALSIQSLFSQEITLSNEYKKETIEKLSLLI